MAELAPELSIEDCVWSAGFDQLFREAPWRCLLPPWWRGFGSHLSTVELADSAWRLCLPAAG